MEPAFVGRIIRGVELQLVRTLSGETRGTFAAVDFNVERVLMPQTEAAGPERSGRAVLKLDQRLDVVVDIDRLRAEQGRGIRAGE